MRFGRKLQQFLITIHRDVVHWGTFFLLEICTFFSKQPSSAGTTNGSSELSHFEIPYIYFGIFDGHAGSATAVTAANELHQVEIKLQEISQ